MALIGRGGSLRHFDERLIKESALWRAGIMDAGYVAESRL